MKTYYIIKDIQQNKYLIFKDWGTVDYTENIMEAEFFQSKNEAYEKLIESDASKKSVYSSIEIYWI